MFSTLRSRLMLTYSLLVGFVLCVVVVGLLFYLVRNPFIDRQDFAQLERVLGAITPRLGIRLENPQRISLVVNRIDELFDVRVLVFQSNLNILADSRINNSEPLLLDTRRQFQLHQGYVRDTSGKIWLYVTEQLQDGGYLIVLSERRTVASMLFLDRVRNLMRDDFIPPIFRTGGVALIIALLFAYWISKWISSPLQRISTASREVAKGEYSRIKPEGPVEVQGLVNAFNDMSLKVRSTQKSQREFLANVSHDLKTPLTSIQGFAQAILDDTVTDEDEIHQAAKIIYTESERMHVLVSDLLELARFDAGTIKINRINFDLRDLLESQIETIEPRAKTARLKIKGQLEHIPDVFGDPGMLTQVFSNLLDNAIKFTPRGGTITVRSNQIGETIQVSFSDTGVSINPEDYSKIFERFYQLDKSRSRDSIQGVGLGLSIAKEIVLSHGGSISVEKNNPTGNVFIVKLPIPVNALNKSLTIDRLDLKAKNSDG